MRAKVKYILIRKKLKKEEFVVEGGKLTKY